MSPALTSARYQATHHNLECTSTRSSAAAQRRRCRRAVNSSAAGDRSRLRGSAALSKPNPSAGGVAGHITDKMLLIFSCADERQPQDERSKAAIGAVRKKRFSCTEQIGCPALMGPSHDSPTPTTTSPHTWSSACCMCSARETCARLGAPVAARLLVHYWALWCFSCASNVYRSLGKRRRGLGKAPAEPSREGSNCLVASSAQALRW